MLFCSHITSLSSTVLPVGRICAEARRQGVATVIDGAHGPGQIELDLPRLGADVYVGNARKWPLAPRGAAFIHASGVGPVWIRGPVVSWGWTWADSGYQGRFAWPGTFDPTALLSVPAAIAFRDEHDWPAVIVRCRALAQETLAGLAAAAVPTAPQPPQMVSAFLPIDAPHELQAALWRDHRIEIPVDTLGSTPLIRLSVQAYTTAAECELLVSAVARYCTRG